MGRPLTPYEQPPEGHTVESWAAMRRASDVLNFEYRPPAPRSGDLVGVEIPAVERRYRNDYFGSTRQKNVPTLTYVVKCGDFVKIGMASDVAMRFRSLVSGTPYDLAMLKVFAGGREIERSLHLRFAAHRHRDEWFRIEGELAAWIEAGFPL